MGYSRGTTPTGKMVYFTYSPSILFLRVQQLSQFHAFANKDAKTGEIPLDLAFSDDHKEYFDTYCKEALAYTSDVYQRVNAKHVVPFSYFSDGFKETASIRITDHGFVKDSLLSVLDNQIEEAIVNFVLGKWYEHIGQPELMKKYAELVNAVMIALNESLYQFLRKVSISTEGIMLYWINPICVQRPNYTMTIKWENTICVSVIDNPLSLSSDNAP